MILIWGLPNDPSTRAVREWLAFWRAPVFFLNHAEIFRTEISLTTDPQFSFQLKCGSRSCCLDDVRAAYLRPYNYRDYPPFARSEPHQEPAMVHHMMSAWAEYSPALIVSRPSAEGTNQSKLYQAVEIRAAGFLTPESMVANDPAEIREFLRRRGRLIYKSMSNVRSIVKELSEEDFDGKTLGPTLFQEFVEGGNIRVHVVGGEVFASAIQSAGVDYRYAPAEMAPMELPGEIAARSVALAGRLGLTLAGLDLIRTHSGDWYCLEVNPNPAFTSFPDGDQVARALAGLLADSATVKGPRAPKVKRTRPESVEPVCRIPLTLKPMMH